MRITRLGGLISTADTTLYQAEKIECLFEADGAIAVGGCVKLDPTANTTGKLVVATSAVLDHRSAVGIYEGEGGSGAAATVSGTKGNAAVDGDLIMVTTYGIATALQDGGTNDTVVGEALQPEATSGYLIGTVTAVTNAGIFPAQFVCLEAVTTDGGAGAVFCRCM